MRFLTLNLYVKNQVDLSVFTSGIVNSRILQSDWPKAFLLMPNLKFTNHFLHFLNSYLHAKKQVDSSVFS